MSITGGKVQATEDEGKYFFTVTEGLKPCTQKRCQLLLSGNFKDSVLFHLHNFHKVLCKIC